MHQKRFHTQQKKIPFVKRATVPCRPISCLADTIVLSINLVRLVWQVSDNHSLNIQGAWTIIRWERMTCKSDRAETLMDPTLLGSLSRQIPKPLLGLLALRDEDEFVSAGRAAFLSLSLPPSLFLSWSSWLCSDLRSAHTCTAHVSTHQWNDWIDSAVKTVWIILYRFTSLPSLALSPLLWIFPLSYNLHS